MYKFIKKHSGKLAVGCTVTTVALVAGAVVLFTAIAVPPTIPILVLGGLAVAGAFFSGTLIGIKFNEAEEECEHENAEQLNKEETEEAKSNQEAKEAQGKVDPEDFKKMGETLVVVQEVSLENKKEIESIKDEINILTQKHRVMFFETQKEKLNREAEELSKKGMGLFD